MFSSAILKESSIKIGQFNIPLQILMHQEVFQTTYLIKWQRIVMPVKDVPQSLI